VEKKHLKNGEKNTVLQYKMAKRKTVAKPGYYDGRHYTTYVNDVKNLKKSGELEEVEKLLLELVVATEAESAVEGWCVAPWYYEELAKVYRKQKEYVKEVAILERFAAQKHGPSSTPPKLLERLEKARQLMVSANKPMESSASCE